jgi:DNA-binding NarL/FixJ family response regulator
MIRCLLITPERTVRDQIRVGLEQTQAFEIEWVSDDCAVEAVRTNDYDAVICDTSLADGGDGLELVGELRPILPDATFMLITRTRTQSRYLSRERQSLGVAGFLQVPIEPVDFFRSVARLAERLQAAAA